MRIRRFYAVLYLTMFSVFGCAVHTQKTAFEVENFAHSWMNQPFEEFITYHPEIKGQLPIGNGNMRYEYECDLFTTGEMLWTLMDVRYNSGGMDAYYTIYIFVNEKGIIYDMHLHGKIDH